ncbi:hypothetical protein EV188_10150 [Actinomycetospora succinea]|uniref:Uncharacterized protein n=1 Tax=Actinomycetospora succinea TaxID=663603 RepID=A0A4R6VLM6_9PSEU|nr:hypothetical protein [Actinomycetospora succinea]TDQ64803.1 hypothetical protein EV188_10150 [Actinomycetospora succinea]
MFQEQRRRWAEKRLQPGDGSALERFRWWQTGGRSLFYLRAPDAEYAVDVRHWKNQNAGVNKAQFYVDGRQQVESKLPAAFPVPGGTIEVAVSTFGIQRAHFVTPDGAEHVLTPDARSAEARRARLDRRHPALSRGIGVLSVLLLVVGVGLMLLQVAEPISRIPPIAMNLGIFHSPVDLPLWLNVALGVGAALGSMERALRMRYHWLLDALGN